MTSPASDEAALRSLFFDSARTLTCTYDRFPPVFQLVSSNQKGSVL